MTQKSHAESSQSHLSYILIAFFNVLCSTHDQLVNVVYFCFLSSKVRQDIFWIFATLHRSTQRLEKLEELNSPAVVLSQQRSPEDARSPPPSPRFA